MQRPDLTNVDPEILQYIQHLEKRLGIRTDSEHSQFDEVKQNEPVPPEPPTTTCVVTLCQSGLTKKTYRHLYTRQHRGGMGVFGIDVDPPDYPKTLANLQENRTLILLTNKARVFRLQLNALEPAVINSRGIATLDRLGLATDETVVMILPEQATGYIALVSEVGKVRSLRHHLFGEHMKPGTTLFNVNEFGPLAAACWTPGDGELFIVTQAGIGIRFAEKAIPPQGSLGIKVGDDDQVAGITPVSSDGNVFILGADGRGTLRQMSGFAANKTPGGSGKIAIRNPKVIGAVAIEPEDDLLIMTRLGKIIRFRADEVPSSDGVVQGVNCISMRSDEACALLRCPIE
jgi:DNA gyrase subunit A